LDLDFDKSKFTCKQGDYCIGKAGDLASPFLQQRSQEYRRTISGKMKPLAATDAGRIPKTKGLYATRKYDGEFAMIFFNGSELLSVNPGGTVRVGLSAYIEAEKLLKKAKVKSCILGAEIYVKDEPSQAHRVRQVVSILRSPSSEKDLDRLGVAVFDVIELDGERIDSTEQVYKLITKWFKGGKKVHAAEFIVADDTEAIMEAFTDWVVGEGAEGLVIRHDRAGWFKLKSRHNIDAAIIGFTEGTDGRKGLLHDLLVAVIRDDGTFHELGRVGGGFTEDVRKEIAGQLRRRIVPSDYVAVNNDYVAYEMIHPGPVIELSCLDLIPERATGGPVNRMVLSWDGDKYTALKRMPIVSMISPQFVRIRDDKEAVASDVNIRQISDLVAVPKVEETAVEPKGKPSELLERSVYTKTMKGNKMVRKMLLWKTNKEDEGEFPAYVVYLTDFSPNRANPLERDVKVAQSEKAARHMFTEMAKQKFLGGWEKVK
jgi:ATP-dependent DNA ligase